MHFVEARRLTGPNLLAGRPLVIVELVVDQIEPAEPLPEDRDLVRRAKHRLLASARARAWMTQRWDRWIYFKNLDE